ncbi:RICIN domain-containing protein [Pedobacter sp. MC2016-14]|uniref:RICIN domain-containing protein n=1 Tax=Pedobacter sp. MC2016-14 TaxID=2897327 RepID=UPI001E5413A1|nr:RICIN domain-containing protein [Pedobacter sp. MC2016-14]MCD0489503.1 RICIN domain-containing protein [Pedobacter sp. MC2016-14]
MKKKSTISNFLSLMLLVVLGLTSCKKQSNDVNEEIPAAPLKNPLKVASIPATETLQTVGNGTFLIVNRKSGMPLNVASASTANGANVVQYGAGGGTNERWTLTQLSGGYYSIVGVPSGLSLAVAGASTANNADINIYTSSTGNEQQWQFTSIGNGYYRIINRNSGKDIDVVGQSVEPGAAINQYDYWGGENQQWGLLPVSYSGQLTWTLTSTGVPADVLTRITNAMNDACARYNAGANWPARTLTVQYNTGVATADGSTNGNIRFGPTASYQGVRTAMHEIAHTYGVGLSAGFTANLSSSDFVGANAVNMVKSFDGAAGAIHTGGGHIWPYGLNYDNEWSSTNAYRHVKIIWAMRADGM